MERRDATTADTGLGHDPNDYKRSGSDVYVSDPTGATSTRGARKGQVKWVRYRRMSSLGDITPEPLIRWKNRHIAYGMTLLESPMPFDITEKTFWDSIVDKAEQISGANLAADRGTHIHEMCARASLWWIEHGNERWEHLIEGGDEVGIDRDATLRAVHGFRLLCTELGWEPVKVEAKIVNDELEAAGTVDYIVRSGDAYFVIDLKGSKKLRPSYGCQIMGYGRGVPYRTEDDTRLPMPWPLEDYGYIVKFDREQLVETGDCDWTVHRVDFADAEELLRLVDDVAHRTSPDAAAAMFGDAPHYQLSHTSIAVEAAESPVDAAETVTAETVAARFVSLSGADTGRVRELRIERGVAEDDYAAVLDIINEVDPFQHDAGTGNLDRFTATPPEPVANELVVEEGDPANPNAVGLLNTRFEQLPANQQATIRDYVTEVGNLSISQNPSVRRFNLGAALVKIVDAVGTDDFASYVEGIEDYVGVKFADAGPLGSSALLEAANDLADGHLAVVWDEAGVRLCVHT